MKEFREIKEISQIKSEARENQVPIIMDEGLGFILDYIKKNDVRFILEIGTAVAYSAIQFAKVSPNIRVFTIEYDILRYHEAVKNVVNCGLSHQITVFLGDALKFDFTEQFDLIFIDPPYKLDIAVKAIQMIIENKKCTF